MPARPWGSPRCRPRDPQGLEGIGGYYSVFWWNMGFRIQENYHSSTVQMIIQGICHYSRGMNLTGVYLNEHIRYVLYLYW